MILCKDGRLNTSTGVRGIAEEYASARGIGERAKEAILDHPSSSMGAVPRGLLDAKAVFEHAKEGDDLACEIVASAMDVLGVLCIDMCRAYDPEVPCRAQTIIMSIYGKSYLFWGLRPGGPVPCVHTCLTSWAMRYRARQVIVMTGGLTLAGEQLFSEVRSLVDFKTWFVPSAD